MNNQEIQQLVNAIDTAAYNLRHMVKCALDPMAHRPNASAVEKTESFRRLQMADANEAFDDMSGMMADVADALNKEQYRQSQTVVAELLRITDKDRIAEEALDNYNDQRTGLRLFNNNFQTDQY